MNEIEKRLTAELKSLGFKKRRSTWYFGGQDALCIVNLQKSRWGPECYINLGVSLKELTDDVYPPFYHAHAYGRMEHLLKAPKRGRDLLKSLSEGQRSPELMDQFMKVFLKQAMPALLSMSTLAGFRKLLKGKLKRNWLILTEGLNVRQRRRPRS